MATVTHEQIQAVYDEAIKNVNSFPPSEPDLRATQTGLEIVSMLGLIAHALVDLANQPQAIAVAQSASASQGK